MPLWVGVLTQSTQRKRKPKKGPRCKITLIKLLKTRASKTLKAFNNIQCLRLLKASGAKKNKAAKHVKTPQRRTIKGFRQCLWLYTTRYGSYTWILHKNQTQRRMLLSTSSKQKEKKEIALQSQCLVSTDEPLHIMHKKILKATKPAFIKEKTLKKKASRFHFTFNPETS